MFVGHFPNQLALAIPKPNRHIIRHAGNPFAIRGKEDPSDPFFVGINGANFFAGSHIPPDHFSIVTGGNEGTICQQKRSNVTGMAAKCPQFRLGLVKIDFMNFEITSADKRLVGIWNSGQAKENILAAMVFRGFNGGKVHGK